MKRWLLIGAFFLSGVAPARAEEGPSFSCAKASTAIERAICASPGLAALDRELAAAFQAALPESGKDRDAAVREQRAWLGAHERECRQRDGKPKQADGLNYCLRTRYRERTALLRARVAGAAPGSTCDRIERAVAASGSTDVAMVVQPGGPLTLVKPSRQSAPPVDQLDDVDEDTYKNASFARAPKSPLVQMSWREGSAACGHTRFFKVKKGGAEEVQPAEPVDETVCDWSPLPALATDDAGNVLSLATADRVYRWTGSAWSKACALKVSVEHAIEPFERVCSSAMCKDLEAFVRAWIAKDPAVDKLPRLEVDKVLGEPVIGAAGMQLDTDPFEFDHTQVEVVETTLDGTKRLIVIGEPTVGWRTFGDTVYGVYARGKPAQGLAFMRTRDVVRGKPVVARVRE